MEDMIELLSDPDFVTDFVLGISVGKRTDGGKWVEGEEYHKKEGVIQPAPSKDTQYLEDGDKNRLAIKIWSCEYLSAADRHAPQLGDIIEWHCERFRIVNVKDWSQYGYWQAVAVQLTGGKP